MKKKSFLFILMIVIAFQVPINAEVTKCEKAERYRKLVIEKFIQPEQKQDALVLLSREIITPELARQKCNSLILERGAVTTWLTDKKTGKKTTTADVTKFVPEKLMENTILNAQEGVQTVGFEYKEEMPYLKIWIQNQGMKVMKVNILPKGGDSTAVQDSFEVAPNNSQVIYYFADAKAKNKNYQVQVMSDAKTPLQGMMAMKAFQKTIERKENVHSVFGD